MPKKSAMGSGKKKPSKFSNRPAPPRKSVANVGRKKFNNKKK